MTDPCDLSRRSDRCANWPLRRRQRLRRRKATPTALGAVAEQRTRRLRPARCAAELPGARTLLFGEGVQAKSSGVRLSKIEAAVSAPKAMQLLRAGASKAHLASRNGPQLRNLDQAVAARRFVRLLARTKLGILLMLVDESVQPLSQVADFLKRVAAVGSRGKLLRLFQEAFGQCFQIFERTHFVHSDSERPPFSGPASKIVGSGMEVGQRLAGTFLRSSWNPSCCGAPV